MLAKFVAYIHMRVWKQRLVSTAVVVPLRKSLHQWLRRVNRKMDVDARSVSFRACAHMTVGCKHDESVLGARCHVYHYLYRGVLGFMRAPVFGMSSSMRAYAVPAAWAALRKAAKQLCQKLRSSYVVS